MGAGIRCLMAVFHTGSDEILAVGMAWERG